MPEAAAYGKSRCVPWKLTARTIRNSTQEVPDIVQVRNNADNL